MMMTKQLHNLVDILKERILEHGGRKDYEDEPPEYFVGRLSEAEYILKIVNLMIRNSTQAK